MTEASATPGLIRSFVAIPLPSSMQGELATAAAELARALPGDVVKWSKKPENFHVTLKFLGPVDEARLAALGAALAEALVRAPRFSFTVRGFDAFPSPRHAKTVFAGAESGPGARAVGEVAALVESVAAGYGFPRDERAFTTHVTVGRSKEGVDARAALAPFSERRFGEVRVEEVHVYESQLGGEGSTYVLRHRAALASLSAN